MPYKKYILLSSLFILLTFFYYTLIHDFERTPATIYTNGNIITLDETSPIAEAMYIKNGIIQSIGSIKEIERLQIKHANRVNLNGQTVMPGFIDPHTHFALSLFLSEINDLSGFTHKSNKGVWAHFKRIVSEAKKGEWIIFKGIDPILVEDLVMPSLAFLDKIAPGNPVFIFSQSLHNYWANSLAFKEANITEETLNPSATSYYEKDSLGNLTGHIIEQEAVKPLIEILKKDVLTAETLSKNAVKVMKNYAKNGNTTLVSVGLTISDKNPLILLKYLSNKTSSLLGNLLALFNILPERAPALRHFIYMRQDMEHLFSKTEKESNDFYNIIGIKHWYDGSPYTGSMYLNSPYLNTKLSSSKLHISYGHTGSTLIKKNDLFQFIKKQHSLGRQISFHTQGDAAIKDVLDAFEELSKETDLKPLRHRLEHCLLLPKSEIMRMKKLHITPSFHINHLYYYGDALKSDILGNERAEKILPLKSVENAGIKYSLHADQPMFESKPFHLIQTAIERKTRSGNFISKDQSIHLKEAIKALTLNAAWQLHLEDKIGSLEKGKYADFIIVSKNPFTEPTNKIKDIIILKTFVHGNLIK